MEPYLRENLRASSQFKDRESAGSSLNSPKTEGRPRESPGSPPSHVNYSHTSAFSKKERERASQHRVLPPESKRTRHKVKLKSLFRFIIHFSIFFSTRSILYSRSAKDEGARGYPGTHRSMEPGAFGINLAEAAAAAPGASDQLVPTNLAALDKVDLKGLFENVSLLVLDTEGLAYKTDFSKRLLWATRVTEDLLRVKKPVSTRHETCAIEDIAPDNMDRNKTMGHQIFADRASAHSDAKGEGHKTRSKARFGGKQDYKFERLKSHLVPSYDGYVYYVDDFNTKLLQVHVKDIVNYTPFYTPLLEGVYLEGSRNSLVVALDYESGTYITRHNRDDDTKNNYVLNYFIKDGTQTQLHIGLTNWSVKAYTEKDHTQIWDFDWLEVGSVMNQNKNDALLKAIKQSISVSSNRLYFNHTTEGPESEGSNHLVFPFQIAAVFAIFESHREGIYTLDLVERQHIAPPPNFLYDPGVTSMLVSSRKVQHKSLYVENGVIGVLEDSKHVTVSDQNTLATVPSKVQPGGASKRIASGGSDLILDGKGWHGGEGVHADGARHQDERRIIQIGSSVVHTERSFTKKQSTTEFLMRWWWLLIAWVVAVVATPIYWAVAKLRSRKKASLASKNARAMDTPSSRTDLYDSKTDLYDSTDESNVESNPDDLAETYLNDDDFSDISVDVKLSADERLALGLSSDIRRVKSEGNFNLDVAEEFSESVWMEEQSLINVITNNQFDLSKKNKIPSMLTIQYPVSTKSGGKSTALGTKDQSTAMVSSSSKSPTSKDAETNGEKHDRDREEKDELSLSVIPNGSALSRFLENGRFLRTFECIKMLGKGGFGSVYRARHKLEPGNPIYAIKFVLLKLKSSEDLSSRRYFREVAANRDIYSKHVVRYYTWWCEEPHFLPLAQMSNQLQMAAIDNLRYLIQNDIIPSDIINPNAPAKSHDAVANSEKTKLLNNYINEYRDIIYHYIQNPKQDDLFPNFSQIAQKNKANIKFMSSFTPNREPNLEVYSENSNIQFKDTNPDADENHSEARWDLDFENKRLKERLSIINEHETKLVDNKQYQVVLLILMEMCNGLTLREWLNRSERIKSDNKKTELLLFKQIIKGLRDIHRNCFIHRDLKPENIFVDDKNNLKIGDLGLVGFIQENHSSSYHPNNTVQQHLLSDATQVSVRGQVIGTPGYTAPEGGGNCTEKVDIYSAALILLELLCPRFDTVMERLETLEKFRNTHEVPAFIKERFRPWYDLMVQMADANPDNRPSSDQVYRQLKVILNS